MLENIYVKEQDAPIYTELQTVCSDRGKVLPRVLLIFNFFVTIKILVESPADDSDLDPSYDPMEEAKSQKRKNKFLNPTQSGNKINNFYFY